MHPRMLAVRNLEALAQIRGTSVRLAQKLGLADTGLDLEGITSRDPGIRVMLQNEAVAAFLADLEQRIHPVGDVDTGNAAVLERLRAAGVAEGWLESIEKKLAEATA